jgi:hypothetical protein
MKANEIYMVKGLGGKFTPAHDSDHDLAKQLKQGEVYRFTFVKPRNYEFHKKFFALIKLVFENQDHYTNIDDLRHDLTVEAGFKVEKINQFTGEVRYNAQSISFASMDEIEFSSLYQKMLDTVIRVYGWEGTDLEAEVAEFM